MTRPVPDAHGLCWGHTRGFRAVVRDGAPAPAEPAKWFAFLPSSWQPDARQAVFDALARDVLADPALGMCTGAKLAHGPLLTDPRRVVVVFYCNAPDAAALLAGLRHHVRRHRKPLVQAGHLAPGDGVLGGWIFKTDAQTAAEMASGTHPAQHDRLLWLLGMERGVAPGRPRR